MDIYIQPISIQMIIYTPQIPEPEYRVQTVPAPTNALPKLYSHSWLVIIWAVALRITGLMHLLAVNK